MTTLRVQGKRSPRWAIWARMTIPCKDGTDYLVRLRIVQTPWFGLYVHDIHEDDGDRHPHNHPWSFLSLVLRGYYTERLYPNPSSEPDEYVCQTHKWLSAHVMGRVSAHRIIDASPGLKTLILTGRRSASCGFFVDGTLVDWQDYERDHGTTPVRDERRIHASR